MKPRKKLFQKTRYLYIAMILALLALALVSASTIVTYIQGTAVTSYNSSSEPGTSAVLHISRCDDLNVNVSIAPSQELIGISTPDTGSYSLTGCSLIDPDYWYCECWDGYDLQMFTVAHNEYILTANYTYIDYNSTGSGSTPSVCNEPWSECGLVFPGMWSRLCYSGGTPIIMHQHHSLLRELAVR
jgi:hypothetical protein